MGLDWLAGNKAAAGHEQEFAAAVEAIVAGRGREVDADRFQAISVPSFASVGAPRVGSDPQADAWLLEQHGGTEDDEALLQRAHGYYVLDLVPDCDGIPVYTNAPFNRELEATSFRGQMLEAARDVVGDDLVDSARERRTPEGLVAYGEALLEGARRYAAEHGCAEVEHQREPPDVDVDEPAAKVHIAFAAAKWCLFWGNRGHWLDVWY